MTKTYFTKTRIGNYLRKHELGDVETFRRGFKEGVAFATHKIAQPLEAEIEKLTKELTEAQDELHCAENTLEAAACDLSEEGFDQGFDCLGDFAMAVWQGFRAERDELKAKLEAAQAEIKNYREWIKQKGENTYTCTWEILDARCDGCRCGRVLKGQTP